MNSINLKNYYINEQKVLLCAHCKRQVLEQFTHADCKTAIWRAVSEDYTYEKSFENKTQACNHPFIKKSYY